MTATVPIADLVGEVSKVDPVREWSGSTFNYVDIAAVDQASKAIVQPQRVDSKDAPSRARQLVRAGDVLVSTVRPNLNAVALVPADLDGAVASTGFTVLRPSEGVVDSGYLFHWVRTPSFIGAMTRQATGASYPAVSDRIVKASEIPLPPFEEQKRIATVLNQADELRAKRRTSLALLEFLLDARFREMFAGAWPSIPLAELLAAPLRNGVSPATSGTVSSRVLTLSAVTGPTFEEHAVKEAKFFADPPSGKRVCSKDLLICRGNGNLNLVGKGYFPGRDMPDVAFPDTVIAARVSAERMDPAFLEHLWGTSQVRRQIESMARTTNGTFKVNQAMLESVEVPDPPLHLQRRFGRTVRSLRTLRQRLKASATSQDALFTSLQHRAFAEQL